MENHFDQAAPTWDMNKMHAERTASIVKFMTDRKWLDHPMTGIEFGSGTGMLSIALKDHFSKITLLDSSQGMIDVCRKKISEMGIPHLIPVCLDLEKEDPGMDPVDMIFNQMALHHVEDVRAMIAKFWKWLRPGGKLVVADLYPEDGTFHDHQSYVHNGFDPLKLTRDLTELGFGEVEYTEIYQMKKPLDSGDQKVFPVFLLWGTAIK